MLQSEKVVVGSELWVNQIVEVIAPVFIVLRVVYFS